MNRFCLLALLVLIPLVAHADNLIADGLKGWERWLEAAEAKPPVTVDHAVFRGADMASLGEARRSGESGTPVGAGLAGTCSRKDATQGRTVRGCATNSGPGGLISCDVRASR